MKLGDWQTMPVDGPLIGLSMRRIQRGCSLPTAAERLAAYRACLPPPQTNSFAWPHLSPPQRANVVRLHNRRKTA